MGSALRWFLSLFLTLFFFFCSISEQQRKKKKRSPIERLRWSNNAQEGWPLDGNVKPWMWMGRSPRSALISHLYLLSNPLWQPSIARDPVCEALLLTQGYISITEGSESDEQLICLINPSFSKKNIWSWGADLLSCSYRRIKMGMYMLHRYAGLQNPNLDSYLYEAHTQQTDRSLPAHILLL